MCAIAVVAARITEKDIYCSRGGGRCAARSHGGFTMQDGRLISLRAEASRGYDLSNSGEAAAGYMQAIMLAEIALQLAKLNETLAEIGKDMSAVNLSDL